MNQGLLFGQSAYGDAAPLAATDDPQTSHEAADRMKASGKLGANEATVFAMVQRRPGMTFREIWRDATDAEREQLGDTTELMRRLSSNMRRGRLKHGAARACSVKSTKMVVWELA